MAKTGARVARRQGFAQRLSQQASRVFAVAQVPMTVALASSALMISEIALTRIFSVVLPHYFVYLLLSVAILGMGLGALLAHWQREHLRNPTSLAWILLAAAFSVLLLTLFFVATVSQRWWLLYLLFSCALFASVGVFLSQVFSALVERSGWLYWADLTGAGLGVLVAFWALTIFGAINALLFAALLFTVSGVLYRPTLRLSQATTILLGLLLLLNLSTGLINLDLGRSESTKTIATALDPDSLRGEVIFSDWDAFARIDVVTYPKLPNERTIFVDGGAGSSAFRVEKGVESLAYLRDDLGYLPFQLFEPQSVLIIGPGGGKDIALALLGGSQAITAVEISPGIVRALDFLSEYNGNLHRHPAVDLHVAEGRSFLKSEQRTYDLIYLSLVANEAADLAGLALAENYIYTEEAFLDYLAHLEPDGAVALRLHGEPHLNRAFVTALNALGSRGLSSSQAMQQIVVLAGLPHPDSPTEIDPLLLVLASPLPPSRAASVLDLAEAARIFPFFIPYSREAMPYAAFAQGKIEIDDFVARLGSSYASPTTDDRPFFYLLQGGLPEELSQLGILLVLAITGWLLYIYFDQKRRPHRRHRFYWWVYFAVIGLGFMLIEIALLQRFNLFLGHPIRSLAVVLGGLLLAAGLGSFAARNYTGPSALSLVGWASLSIVVLGGAYLGFLPALLPALHGASLAVRILLTLGLVLPLGLLLGIPFPLGLRLLTAHQAADDVALAWATNGLFSVAGSVLAMVLAIQHGFSWAWIAGLVGYLVLAGLIWGPMRRLT